MPSTMMHELFGKLRYKDRDESWAGSALLPRFAGVGMLPDPPEMTEEEAKQLTEEMNAQMADIRQQMVERFGQDVLKAFDSLDQATEEQEREGAEKAASPTPEKEERERRREEKRQKHRALLAKGKFPIRIAGPSELPPTPTQEASFRFLLENEQAVFDAVLAEVWQSFQNASEQQVLWFSRRKSAESVNDLAGRFAITRLDVAREARGGFAHLVFFVEADWGTEHGLMVAHSPDRREASWATWDSLYDLLESDEPTPPGEEYVPTPHDLLLEAILTNDEAKTQELIATGADINALGPYEYPPLWIAVDQMEPEEVRLLLAFGADPKLANPDEKTTPLKHARKLYRDLGFAPSKKRDGVMDGILSLMKEAASGQMQDIKNRMETIIKLLEEASGKPQS